MKASIFVSFKKQLHVHGLGLAIAVSFLAATNATAQVTFCGDYGARYQGCGVAVNKLSGCSRTGKETFLCSSSSPKKISSGFGAAAAKQPARQPAKQTVPAKKASSTPKRAKAPAAAPKPLATQDSRCRSYEASGLEPVRNSSSCSDGSTPISCALSSPPFILCPKARQAEMREETPEYTGGGPLETTVETAEQDPTFKSNFGDADTIKKIQDQKNPKPSLLGGSNLEPIPEADKPDLDKIEQNSFDKTMADRKTPAPSLLNKDGTGVNTDYDNTAPSFDADAIQKNSYDKIMADRKTPKPTFLNKEGTGVRTDYDQADNTAPASLPAGDGKPNEPSKPKVMSAGEILGKKGSGPSSGSGDSKVQGPQDRCQNSANFDGDKYGCAYTDNWIEGAELANAAGQVLGNATLSAVGTAEANKAAKEGTLSSGISAAAKAQKAAATVQMTLGLANAAAGGYIYSLSRDHAKNKDELAALKGKADGIQYNVMEVDQNGNFAKGEFAGSDDHRVMNAFNRFDNLDGGVVDAAGVKANRNNFRANAQAAIEEQAATAKNAKGAGIRGMIAGAQQLMLGAFSRAAAKNMESAAKKLQSAETKVPTFNLTGDEFVARQSQSIGGTGGDPGQSAATEDEEVAKVDPNLGDPFGGPFDTAPKDPAPPADPFKSASIPPSQGGGGPGGGPGGSTGVASDGETESAAKMADGGEKVQYQGAGAAPAQAGRGGAKAGNDGMDLSKLFAGLLPKSEEEEKMDQSILDFGGRRGPASENSILGRDSKSLFSRISEVNADKFKHGYLR